MSEAKRKKVKAFDYLPRPGVKKNGFTPRVQNFLVKIEPPPTSPNLWHTDNHSSFPLVSKVVRSYLNILSTSSLLIEYFKLLVTLPLRREAA